MILTINDFWKEVLKDPRLKDLEFIETNTTRFKYKNKRKNMNINIYLNEMINPSRIISGNDHDKTVIQMLKTLDEIKEEAINLILSRTKNCTKVYIFPAAELSLDEAPSNYPFGYYILRALAYIKGIKIWDDHDEI